ncbi:hypothetical protein BraRD5C2_67890 [Bradyrhizobium sp. RD5-C2]|nr:hypothetical protein BraRD5C2_67890 [Bradyrhizobium sp. RD5-C2]
MPDAGQWKNLAAQYREEAARLPPGPKRDEFLKKAENLEQSADNTHRARST